jgi:hypothetical protein
MRRFTDGAFSLWLQRLQGRDAALDHLDEVILSRLKRRADHLLRDVQADDDLGLLENRIISQAREEELFEHRIREGGRMPGFLSGAVTAAAVLGLVFVVVPDLGFVEHAERGAQPKALPEEIQGVERFDEVRWLGQTTDREARLTSLVQQLSRLGYVRVLENAGGEPRAVVFVAREDNLKSFDSVLSSFGVDANRPGVYLLEVER